RRARYLSGVPHAQPGIFAQGTRSHRHLEFDLLPGVAPEAVLEALGPLRQPSVTAGGANIVVGFSPRLWAQLDPDAASVATNEYPGDIPHLPRTQHDLWVWVHGPSDDVLFDVARGTA